jgi:hypothetical protein
VVVCIKTTPINPPDLGLLLGPADVGTARVSGLAERPIVTMALPSAAMRTLPGRIDKSMPAGNEGAGVVVACSAAPWRSWEGRCEPSTARFRRPLSSPARGNLKANRQVQGRAARRPA